MKKLLLSLMTIFACATTYADGWTRCTSAADLTAGGTFIIGYEATAKSGEIIPMKNNGGTATLTKAGLMAANEEAINMATVTETSDFEVEIEASTVVEGAVCIKVGDNYIGNTNTKNNCKLFAEQSATTSFGVVVGDNDVFQLTIAANAEYKMFQYNATSPRFCVYKNGQKDLVIYKKSGVTPPPVDPVAVEGVKLTDSKGNDITTASLKVSETLQLKAVINPSDATNKKVTWSVEGDAVTVEAGLVKAVAEGTATVTVTTEDGNKTASVAITVSAIEASTIADFIANEGGACYLTGIVSNIKNAKFGNFDLTDETGTIYIYGCLTPEGEAQKFATLGVSEGDEIKVIANVYELYNETHEAKNVIFVEKKIPETPVAVEGVKLTNDKGEDVPSQAALTVTETIQLKAVITPINATNKNVTWKVIQDSEVIKFENGLVTALAPGNASVLVTTEDGEFQAAVDFNVLPIEHATVAEFIAAKGKVCYLTGVVSDMVMDTTDPTKPNIYGNFNLTDETGTIYVYGCLTPAGEKKKFDTLGVEEGDEIVVLANAYKAFAKGEETIDEAIDVTFVENHGKPAVYTFEITADASTNNFTVTPSDEEVLYHIAVFDEATMEATLELKGFNEPVEFFDFELSEKGSGLKYFTGVQTLNLEDDCGVEEVGKYDLYVFAVSSDYKRISDVKKVTISVVTGIATIQKANGETVRFNLGGQKVGANAKGIIIMNGKMVMVK